MRLRLAILITFLCLVPLQAADPTGSPTQLESWRLLRQAFGLEQIVSFQTVALIPAEEDSYYGLFEDGEAIDNAEELLTAAYFSRTIKLTDPALVAAFARDFPYTHQGSMNLCSIWLRKKAEQFGHIDANGNDKVQIYDGVVQQIEEPTGLNHDFVLEWYRQNIAAEIRQEARLIALGRTDQLRVSSAQWELAVQALIDYFQEPRSESYAALSRQYRLSAGLDSLLATVGNPTFARNLKKDAQLQSQ